MVWHKLLDDGGILCKTKNWQRAITKTGITCKRCLKKMKKVK